MKFPEGRDFVKGAMQPVADDVGAEKHLQKLQPQRLRGDVLLKVELHCPGKKHLHRNDRDE